MQDWIQIKNGDPLFLDESDKNINYISRDNVYPVFIGEAAYKEKKIAMSFTKKEKIKCSKDWIKEF